VNLTFFRCTFWPVRDAAPDRRLQRHRRLERPEPARHHRGFTIAVAMLPFLWNIFITLRSGEPAGDDRGRGTRWSGHLVPAAAIQLRPPAADPFGAAGVRPPPRQGRAGAPGRALSMARTARPDHPGGGPGCEPAHGQRGISNPILGMILFITSEVMFFAASSPPTQRSPECHAVAALVNEAPFAPFQIHTRSCFRRS